MKKVLAYVLLSVSTVAYSSKDLFFIETLKQCVTVPEWFDTQLIQLSSQSDNKETENPTVINFECDRPLYDCYPGLKKVLPHISCATLPTPIVHLQSFAEEINFENLYIKQDSKTGGRKNGIQLFGGNKVRKLEFLLADALSKQAQTVMTFGCAGSNHVLATCTYAKEAGLKAIALLMPQPANDAVRRNLLLDGLTGAQLWHYPDKLLRSYGACHTFLHTRKEYGHFPYVIPTGGSCPVGVIGFVNAALELHNQIQSGEMPIPDCIVVPSGSYGTVAGLLLGCQMAGIATKMYSISVEPEESPGANKALVQKLFSETNRLLSTLDKSIENFVFPEKQLQIINDFSGEAYGVPTQHAQEAIELLAARTGIELDPTYSGKAFAFLLSYAREGNFKSKTVLFWNTYSEYTPEMQKIADTQCYTDLPKELQSYFEA